MSKVLYLTLVTMPPQKNGWYLTNIKGCFTQFLSGEWISEHGHDVTDLVTHWYSETPSPELAEVLDLLKQHSDREMYTLHKEEIQTLLNELLN